MQFKFNANLELFQKQIVRPPFYKNFLNNWVYSVTPTVLQTGFIWSIWTIVFVIVVY